MLGRIDRRRDVGRRVAVATTAVEAQRVAPRAPSAVRVSDNGRFLVTEDGRPFFYLGDTGWELFHRLTRDEAVRYLQFRADQGYTAIQAVLLAEFDGLTVPNAYGDLPLDRTRSDEARRHAGRRSGVGGAVRLLGSRRLHRARSGEARTARRDAADVGPLGEQPAVAEPTSSSTNGTPKRTADSSAKRYRNHPIIWVLGGDRHTDGVEKVWRALARGIAIGTSGREDYSRVTMTFHPCGACTSSTAFHDDRVARLQHAADRSRARGPDAQLGADRGGLCAHPCQAGRRRRAALRGSSARFPRRAERLLVRRARAAARVLGRLRRRGGDHLRQSRRVAVLRAGPPAGQRTADVLDHGDPSARRGAASAARGG